MLAPPTALLRCAFQVVKSSSDVFPDRAVCLKWPVAFSPRSRKAGEADEEKQRTTQGGAEEAPDAEQDPPPQVELAPARLWHEAQPRPSSGTSPPPLSSEASATAFVGDTVCARLAPVPLPSGPPMTMTPTKPLREREAELRSLLATPAGQKQLQQLESRYHKASGSPRAGNTSVITYIIVHERHQGLISG
jgi:hypothetical protein